MTLRERLSFPGPEELELTEGGIGWPLFYLSLPIIVTNLLHTAYNLADTFWLGQYSTEALAAISFAFPMVFLLISLGLGISVAGSVLVAQHTGADESRQAEYAAAQTMTYALVGAVLVGVVGFFVVHDALALLGAEPAVLPGATAYMQVVSLGLPLMFGFFVFISLMRGYGDTVTPMVVMLGTVVLNVVLDPLVIFGVGPFPELGVEGAAYATVFSRGLAMLVGTAILVRGSRGVRVRPGDLPPDLSYLRKMLRIGVPASIEGTGRALSVNLLLAVVGTFPTVVVAGFGIGIRVFSVVFLPAIAVARGVETMAGQNIGAGEQDRAKAAADFAAKAMFLVLAGVGVVVFLAPGPIVGLFTDDPAVVDAGASFLRIVAPTFGFIGVMRAYTGAFRGAGQTIVAAALAILMMAVVRLPMAWVLAGTMGAVGIWIAFPVSNVVGAVAAVLWFRRGTWRQAEVRGEPGRGHPGTPGAGEEDPSGAGD